MKEKKYLAISFSESRHAVDVEWVREVEIEEGKEAEWFWDCMCKEMSTEEYVDYLNSWLGDRDYSKIEAYREFIEECAEVVEEGIKMYPVSEEGSIILVEDRSKVNMEDIEGFVYECFDKTA